MKIKKEHGRVVVTDNPTPFWAFYSFFILGGLTAVSLSLFAAPSIPVAAACTLIGLGNIAGGMYMIKREPASRVEIDSGSNRIRVCRWGIGGRKETVYPLGALTGADVETTEHTDGGTVYRPRLRFGGSGDVPVSMFWYQTEDASRKIASELEESCRKAP